MTSRTLVLLAVAAPVLLAACDNGPSPLQLQSVRPGADRWAPVTRTLPSATEQRYDPGVAPSNEEKGSTVGAIVPPTGGQRAQKEKDRKEQAAIDAERARQSKELARQQNIDAKVSTQ
jgi:hypothetical protein